MTPSSSQQSRSLPGQAGPLLGALFVGIFATAATFFARTEWLTELRISPLIVGIVLGMMVGNTFRRKLPGTWSSGIRFCAKRA